MELRDSFIAQEYDVKAGEYVLEELQKREDEREERDRDFWTIMFGGEVPDRSEQEEVKQPADEDEAIRRSPLGQR